MTVLAGIKGKPKHEMLVGLLIVVVVIASAYLYSLSQASNQCSGAAHRPMLKQVSAYLFNNQNQLQFSKVVKQIQQTAHYQRDPTCDIVLVAYYVNNQDATNSQKYLTQFNKVYKSGKVIDPALGLSATELDSLKSSVASLQTPPPGGGLITNEKVVPAE